jgi:hypothetical protein
MIEATRGREEKVGALDAYPKLGYEGEGSFGG